MAKIRTQLDKNADALVVSALDEVACTHSNYDFPFLCHLTNFAGLLNIRGTDIDFNPVVISYAIVTKTDVMFFVNPSKVTEEVKAHLEGVTILPYHPVTSPLFFRFYYFFCYKGLFFSFSF